MIPESYQAVLDRCGGLHQPLANPDRWAVIQAWREVYAAGLHAATGRWKRGQFEWHVFSFGHTRALNGERSALAYTAERPGVLIVCPESVNVPAVRLVNGALPDFRLLCDDVYVWPEDLTWTMAFTHEESWGFGPYYCRREWVVPSRPGKRTCLG
jgi:Domain of unknown function (DUF4275)